MSVRWVLVRGGGHRPLQSESFPLTVGGRDADIPLPGSRQPSPSLLLGLSGGEVFAQPRPDGEPANVNGAEVKSSQWLRPGDELRVGRLVIVLESAAEEQRLVVREPVIEQPTEPPEELAGALVEPAPEIIEPVEFQPRAIDVGRARRRRFRPSRLITWSLLALTAAVLWFVFSARSVTVEIDPVVDEVTFEGAMPRFEIGGSHLLLPGPYTIRAARDGYVPLETQVEITRESRQRLRFTLEKLPGRLSIDTGEATGVTVWIDGVRTGETPLQPVELAAGEHEVAFRSDSYEDTDRAVEISGEGKTQSLSVDLTPLWAPVGITSRPEGATAAIDGREVGATPLTVDVLAGTHSLVLARPGFKPHRVALEIAPDTPLELETVTLVPADGRVLVRSEPAGVNVSVDGRFRGQTPVDLTVAPGREHKLVLAEPGYETGREEVSVRPGETAEVDVRLTPIYGEVEVTSVPADAELLVDGESRGAAAQTLRLLAVSHEIVVRRQGFEDYRARVTPQPGHKEAVRAILKSEEQVRAEALEPMIRGPQGQELRLVQPGRFRMGASRREPGRRANETLRDVELTKAFYLAKIETTNGEFRAFRSEHDSEHIGSHSLDLDDQPVVRVAWEDAALYCNWLSRKESLDPVYVYSGGRILGTRPLANGYRLPTEAEWAWAARFAGRSAGLKYPWGNSLPVEPGSGNYADSSSSDLLSSTLVSYDDRHAVTAPVDSFPDDALGFKSLGGNVAEWVHDLYTIYASSGTQLATDPLGPEEGEYHVIRGSSWMDSSVTELRLSYRDYGDEARSDLGFRIARNAE